MNISKVQPYLSIKAFVTAVFTVTTALMFYEGRDIPGELMVINTVVIIDYFRSQENKSNVAALMGTGSTGATSAPQQPLAEPYSPKLDGPG